MNRYDLTGIPGDVLLGDNCVNQIHDAIEKVQINMQQSRILLKQYKDFCNIVIGEMNEKAEFKNVHIRNDLNKRRKHVKKKHTRMII